MISLKKSRLFFYAFEMGGNVADGQAFGNHQAGGGVAQAVERQQVGDRQPPRAVAAVFEGGHFIHRPCQ